MLEKSQIFRLASGVAILKSLMGSHFPSQEMTSQKFVNATLWSPSSSSTTTTTTSTSMSTSKCTHLVFVVHGIGESCEIPTIRKRPIHDCGKIVYSTPHLFLIPPSFNRAVVFSKYDVRHINKIRNKRQTTTTTTTKILFD